jgi:hypothetical protein
MGTSVSQASPRNNNWNPIFAFYANSTLPEERIIQEIWRASERQENPISSEMKSDLIYQCYQVVRSSNDFKEAIEKFNRVVISSKQNSIIAEFAKRGIPSAFQSENPSSRWKENIFNEITKYVISRDASGFVGDKYRNKNVRELIEFKQRIGGKVADIVSSERGRIESKEDWNNFIDSSISKLKSNR